MCDLHCMLQTWGVAADTTLISVSNGFDRAPSWRSALWLCIPNATGGNTQVLPNVVMVRCACAAVCWCNLPSGIVYELTLLAAAWLSISCMRSFIAACTCIVSSVSV
jgi:hypothetical protein